MASIISNLRNRIINDPTGVRAEIGTQIGTQGVHEVPILPNPMPRQKVEQAQKTTEPPLSQPIAYNFIFLKGTDLVDVLPIALPSSENLSTIGKLRECIINDPTSVKAEIGTQIGTQGVHDVPILSDPKAGVKVEQLQETADAPLSKPIASNFLFLKGADLGEAGEAQCDKCKLKGEEGGEPIKSEGYVLIACGKPRR